MSTHTPGPWRWSSQRFVTNDGRPTYTLIGDAAFLNDPILICDGKDASARELPGYLYGPSMDPRSKRGKANANLIVAAPKILAALEHARLALLAHDKADPVLRIVDAAIAEAKNGKPRGNHMNIGRMRLQHLKWDPRVHDVENAGLDDGRFFVHLKPEWDWNQDVCAMRSKSFGSSREVEEAMKGIRPASEKAGAP